MHEVFKIKSSKTNPKFQQYLINFENPQNPQKAWMHEMQENRSLPHEEKLGEAWRNLVEQIWGRELGEKTTISLEGYQENDRRIAQGA